MAVTTLRIVAAANPMTVTEKPLRVLETAVMIAAMTVIEVTVLVAERAASFKIYSKTDMPTESDFRYVNTCFRF